MSLRPREDLPEEDLLESWKAIASYLHRDIRTARRWERTRRLPVHRAPGGRRPGVFSSKTELAQWREDSCPLRTIAVLPFIKLSSEAETQWFADGLVDEIIASLTDAPEWRVTARSSVFAIRGKDLAARELGRLLGAKLLLEGSVQRSDGVVRVTVQLVDAERGYQVWSGRYDRPMSDVFAVEDDLTREIVAGVLRAVEHHSR